MNEVSYQDIQRALITVAMALTELHDPLYVEGMHKEPGYVKMCQGLEELRAYLQIMRPANRRGQRLSGKDNYGNH